VVGRIRSIEKSNDIGNRKRDLTACSIVPQPTTLQRSPFKNVAAEFLMEMRTKKLNYGFQRNEINYNKFIINVCVSMTNNTNPPSTQL
jgi:hypothetical protein